MIFALLLVMGVYFSSPWFFIGCVVMIVLSALAELL